MKGIFTTMAIVCSIFINLFLAGNGLASETERAEGAPYTAVAELKDGQFTVIEEGRFIGYFVCPDGCASNEFEAGRYCYISVRSKGSLYSVKLSRMRWECCPMVDEVIPFQVKDGDFIWGEELSDEQIRDRVGSPIMTEVFKAAIELLVPEPRPEETPEPPIQQDEPDGPPFSNRPKIQV